MLANILNPLLGCNDLAGSGQVHRTQRLGHSVASVMAREEKMERKEVKIKKKDKETKDPVPC